MTSLPSFLSTPQAVAARFPSLFGNAVPSAPAPAPTMGRDTVDFSPMAPRPADFSPLPPAGWVPPAPAAPSAPPPPPPPPPPPIAPPPPPPAPPVPGTFQNLLGNWAAGITAAPAPAAVGPVDGQAPDPARLRAVILDYRKALLDMDQQTRGYSGMIFSNLSGGNGAVRPIFLLPGMMDPHGYAMLCLAWLGRDAKPEEIARWNEIRKADPREGANVVMQEIVNRGTLARLQRTDGSAAALKAIHDQVAGMLVWQAEDFMKPNAGLVPPIPAGPALDPIRAQAARPVGTPNADRARSDEANRALRAAIEAYRAEINKGSIETMIFSGALSGNTVYLLPGLMLPHGAKMVMLAWLGREPNADEMAKWQGWVRGEGGRNAKDAFGDVLKDIERIALAARLPETDGSPAAIVAMRQEVAGRMVWR